MGTSFAFHVSVVVCDTIEPHVRSVYKAHLRDFMLIFRGFRDSTLPGADWWATGIDPLFDNVTIPANQHAKTNWRWHTFGIAETIDMTRTAIEHRGNLIHSQQHGGWFGISGRVNNGGLGDHEVPSI